MKLNTCEKAESGNIISPKGRLSYAHSCIYPYIRSGLDENGKKFKPQYNISLLLPPESDLSLLKAEMKRVALKHVDEETADVLAEKRFFDPTNLPYDGKCCSNNEMFQGWTLLRASSLHKPLICNPDGSLISPDHECCDVYSGRWARALLKIYWSDEAIYGPNVCIGLQSIQLLDHDKPFTRSKSLRQHIKELWHKFVKQINA
jgi:hypothetical protein